MERSLRSPRLKASWKRYEFHVNRLFNDYSKLSEAQRIFKPSPKSWSIAQVFFHLEQVQELSRVSMEHRIKTGKIKPSEWKHSWRYLKLVIALMLPVKYKVPMAAASAQSDRVPHHQYPASWEKSMREMELFLKPLSPKLGNCLLFIHPLAGPLSVDQAIGFLTAHLKHHKRQLQRIKSSEGFPKA